MLVRRNEIRVRSHYGLARAKGSRELRRRVLSDIVKRRSFRVSQWPQAIRYALPARSCRCPQGDRRGSALSAYCLTAESRRFDLASWSF
jgi:hypothetical protein